MVLVAVMVREEKRSESDTRVSKLWLYHTLGLLDYRENNNHNYFGNNHHTYYLNAHLIYIIFLYIIYFY